MAQKIFRWGEASPLALLKKSEPPPPVRAWNSPGMQRRKRGSECFCRMKAQKKRDSRRNPPFPDQAGQLYASPALFTHIRLSISSNIHPISQPPDPHAMTMHTNSAQSIASIRASLLCNLRKPTHRSDSRAAHDCCNNRKPSFATYALNQSLLSFVILAWNTME